MAGKMKFLVAADGSVESQSVVKYVAATLSPVDTGVVFLHVLNFVLQLTAGGFSLAKYKIGDRRSPSENRDPNCSREAFHDSAVVA